MNLATFRLRIGISIGLDTSSGSTELTLIDGWILEGINDFNRRTKCHKRLLSMALTADEAEYTLDTDILSFEKVWIDASAGSSPYESRVLEPIDAAEIFAMQAYESPAEVGPLYYSLEGAHLLLLHPAPSSSSDLLKGIYVPRATAMSVTSDSPSSTAFGGIPEEFHPTIEAYGKWKAADYDDDSSSQIGLQYQAEYEKGIKDAVRDLTLKGGVRLAPARWGKRSTWRRFPHDPSTDWGY